jgi:LDH2 family malate/lactate/ureidoglycolate dehydrogenase
MPTFEADRLRSIVSSIFMAVGTPIDEADVLAEHLVKANLYGHDSHGIIRIPYYLNVIEGGRFLKPGAKIKIVNETVSTAIIDGNHNFGQITGRKAMEVAIKKAKSTGIGMVTLFNVFHTGRVGEYSEMALEHDMVGIVFGGGSKSRQVVAPTGITRLLGTNPIAISVPTHKEKPFRLDMATSIVAGGKISWYLSEGKKVPEGWILDSNGNPTTNPKDFRPSLKDLGESIGAETSIERRGSLMPFGDYKGWNIGLFIQLLGDYLAESGKGHGGGFIFIAIDISKFRPVEEFKKNVDQQIRIIKASTKRPGVQEILIAGDPEYYSYNKRIKEGIYIGEKPWKEIKEIAENLGVDVKSIS